MQGPINAKLALRKLKASTTSGWEAFCKCASEIRGKVDFSRIDTAYPRIFKEIKRSYVDRRYYTMYFTLFANAY